MQTFKRSGKKVKADGVGGELPKIKADNVKFPKRKLKELPKIKADNVKFPKYDLQSAVDQTAALADALYGLVDQCQDLIDTLCGPFDAAPASSKPKKKR